MKVGWRAIGEDFKELGISVITLKRYIKKYKMPMPRTPSGRPVFSKELFFLWILKREDLYNNRDFDYLLPSLRKQIIGNLQ